MYSDNDDRWFNVFGDEVDLDNIDREYALNIFAMVMQRHGKRFSQREEVMDDPLTQRLRTVILTGREPNLRDRVRGKVYNFRCRLAGLPYRSGVPQ